MSSVRHRGTHTRRRGPARPTQAVAAVVVGGVIVGSFAAVRAVGSGGDSPDTTSFTGVVTEFADDGALMCVQRPGSSDAPFCDLYYVPPGTPRLRVGDRVLVTTIASHDADGSPVSGMLVSPVP